MSIEMGPAIEALLFWEYDLKEKKGPVTFDIGVYSHNPHEAPPGSTDILTLGKENEVITLPDFIGFLEEVKAKADAMAVYGTYYYEGISKPRKYKKYPTKVDFAFSWGT